MTEKLLNQLLKIKLNSIRLG